jgi:hypothetical protein
MPEFPAGDPRQIWQRQTTESFRMSAHELRRRTEQREAKSRFETLSSIAVGLIVCAVFAWAAATAHDPATRIGWALVSLSGLYFARQVHKWLWPARLSPAAPLDATAVYYRAILEKRRDFDRQVWRRTGLPLAFLGIAIVLAPPLIASPGLLPKATPFFVLFAVWLGVYFPMRRRARRILQREIDDLRGFETDERL